MRRPCKEKKRTGYKSWIEDIHAGSSENLLGKNDAEGHGYGKHPKGSANRDNHRNEHTTYKVTLLDFFILPLSHHKLYAEADYVAHHNFRKHDNKSVKEHFKDSCGFAGSRIVLVANVVHSHKKGRNQGNDHEAHDTFRINGIVNGHSRLAGGIGDECEGFETVENTAEGMEFPAFLHMWPDFVKKFLYHIVFFLSEWGSCLVGSIISSTRSIFFLKLSSQRI